MGGGSASGDGAGLVKHDTLHLYKGKSNAGVCDSEKISWLLYARIIKVLVIVVKLSELKEAEGDLCYSSSEENIKTE